MGVLNPTEGLNYGGRLPIGPHTGDDGRSTMGVRVFAGAVSSALVLFAHTAWNAAGVWSLFGGFGFLLVATAAATTLTPSPADH